MSKLTTRDKTELLLTAAGVVCATWTYLVGRVLAAIIW